MDLTPVYNLLEPIVEAHGIELYDIEYLTEYGRQVLRLYIDKENGISLDDCENITYAVQPALDAADPIAGPYILEVSSPGIERKLVKDKHYTANIGKQVEIRLNKPLNGNHSFGNQKKFRGELLGLDEEAVIIKIDEELRIPRENLKFCRLIYIQGENP